MKTIFVKCVLRKYFILCLLYTIHLIRMDQTLYIPHTPSTLCEEISRRLFIETSISNEILYPKRSGEGMQNTSLARLNMKNINVDPASFKKELDDALIKNGLSNNKQELYPELYKNFGKFLGKMIVRIVARPGVQGTAYCQIERHDTIGRFTKSESEGDRCDALKKFTEVMEWVVNYIKNNNSGGNISEANNRFSKMLFNYPAEFENTGSGIQESYKACNKGDPLPYTGGSKSRRTRRRKHSRKSHHKHARKTHHKRKHHSRAARKHKKYSRRR